MNFSQMITSLAMVQLCIRTGDLQLAHDECNRLIAICEAAQQTLSPDGGEALLNYDPLPDIERVSKQGYVSPAAGKA